MLNRPLILGLSGAAVVGAALGLTYFADGDPAKETAAVLTTPNTNGGTPDEGVARSPKAPLVRPVAPSMPKVVRRQSAETPASKIASNGTTGRATPPGRELSDNPIFVTPEKPTFDVVRVNPRGDAVIAGRAAPNAAVVIRDGQTEVGTAQADSRGEWVIIPSNPLPKGSRELTLSATSGDGAAIRSDQNVVIMVPGAVERKSAANNNASQAQGALAVLVPRAGKAGSVVIQKPSAARPERPPTKFFGGKAAAEVTIDSVDYDQSGNVTISGNAAPKAPLSVYIDNKHAGSGVSDPQGRWRVVPGGALTPGDYTLRVDNVGAGGKVLGRAETQFTRAQTSTNGAPNDSVISVEPGNSLWRIARRVYGKGVQYSVIFDANREQIRDPNLIYPGQVFFVPHVN